MYNLKKVNKTMKKIYQTPAMEVYTANLDTSLLVNSPLQVKTGKAADNTIVGDARMESNSRRTVNEDGLRDWDINLW